MYYVESGASFEAIVEVGTAGLVGTISWQIVDNLGNVAAPPTTAGIVESPANTGGYQGTRNAPVALGQYAIVWSDDGTYSANHTFLDDLTVIAIGSEAPLPPIPLPSDGAGPVQGPCTAWTTVEEVAACCSAESVGTYDSLYQDSVDSASRLLFELSGRLYAGTCDDVARPCQTQCGCFGQILDRGHLVNWDGCSWGTSYCGCSPLSKVKLSGYPIREIVGVKIDGEDVDPDTYRLDDWRYLVRTRASDSDDPLFWPACQALDLPDTENGTWSVHYSYGQNPPNVGQAAAAELACQIYLQCSGSEECQLPTGATRITRQGITIERQFFRRDPLTSAWRTGLSSVDLFLNSMNPGGLSRRPAIWAPGTQQYARRVGA